MKQNEYPKILLISDASWREDNNIGNTFSSLFKGWPKDRIAMVYARPALPSTEVCEHFFQISEARMIKRIFKKDITIGQQVINEHAYSDIKVNSDDLETNSGERLYKGFHKIRFSIFLVLRELLWKLSRWNNEELDNFVDEFNPDIILSLATDSIYLNEVQQYISRRTGKKHYLYFVDDIYSVTQFTFSPIYWLYKLRKRRAIRRTVKISDQIFTISNEMKYEYDEKFDVNSFLLTKLSNFEDIPKEAKLYEEEIKLIFTGNLYAGRLKVLLELGSILRELDECGIKSKLTIFSATQLSKSQKKEIEKNQWIDFKGKIPFSEVPNKLSQSDIVVHVESFDLRHKLVTKLSFSTKLVDYFKVGRCVVAIGWKEASSIKYIEESEAGVSITSIEEMETKLRELLMDKQKIKQLGINSFNTGLRAHDIELKRESFYNVLRS